MSASVKISLEGKRLLDILQARLVIATGKKVSQQELIEASVRLSAEREDELLRLMAGVRIPLPPDEVERLMTTPTDWGVETCEEEIDTSLYGRREAEHAEPSP